MKAIKLPVFWRDELKEILLEKGFDAVIEKIEEWLRDNELFNLNEAKPL